MKKYGARGWKTRCRGALPGGVAYDLPSSIREVGLNVELVRESAVIKVTFIEGKPREFDFAKDRHIAPADVEEYVGRRAVELVRAAHKAHPW